MTAVIGYFVCVLAIAPVLSVNAFFWVIGRSPRPHDLLGTFRFAVQSLAGVTSPFKMGLMLAVVTCVFIARSVNFARLGSFLVVALAGVVSYAPALLPERSL